MQMPPSTRQHVKSRASAKLVVGHQHVPGHLAVRVPAAPPPTPWLAGVVCAGMSKLAPGEEGKMEQVVCAAIPVGHMGEKADIALACVYLASSAGR